MLARGRRRAPTLDDGTEGQWERPGDRSGRRLGRAHHAAKVVAVPTAAVLPRGRTQAGRAAEVAPRRPPHMEQPRNGSLSGRGADPESVKKTTQACFWEPAISHQD